MKPECSGALESWQALGKWRHLLLGFSANKKSLQHCIEIGGEGGI